MANPSPHAELAALRALRDTDPAGLLRRLDALPAGWPDALPAHEAGLLRAELLLLAASAHFWLADYTGVGRELDAFDRCVVLPADADAGQQRRSRLLVLQATNLRAFAAHRTSDFPGALKGYLDAAALARALGEHRSEATLESNIGNTYEESGLAAEAIEHHRNALALARELGMEELALDVHHNLGNALAASGDVDGGLALHRRAFDGFGALGLPGKQALALLGVAERLVELGRHDEALEALARRAALQAAQPSAVADAYASGLAARIALAQGDAEAARPALERALADTRRTDDRAGQARALVGLARLDLDAGRLADAGARAQDALDTLAGTDALRELADAHLCASRVAEAGADAAGALRRLKDHHAVYERLFNERSARQARLLAVRHQVELARAEADRQRIENSRLTEALAEVGARLAQLESGARAPARPAHGPDALRALGLTAREAEVLYWVTQGKTNEDVATILGTGMPAVKKHLGRIYDKLGVENRTAAAAEVRRRVAG